MGLTDCWLCRSFGHLTCVLQPTVVQRLSITAGIVSCARQHRFQHPSGTHFNGSEDHLVKEGVFPVRVGPCQYKISSGYSTRCIVACLTMPTSLSNYRTAIALLEVLVQWQGHIHPAAPPKQTEIVNFSRRHG